MIMPAVLLIPVLTAIICLLLKNPRIIGYASLAGAALLAAVSVPLISSSIAAPSGIFNDALYMDALSGYIMALVILLGVASAAYSIGYLQHELRAGLTDIKGIRRYYALLHLFIFTMLLVTTANNLALMWIAIEATTAVSALLIGLGFYKRPLAIEAAWKYLILCTVGITFALLGTFITYYASTQAAAGGSWEKLNWTYLKSIAGGLNPSTMKLAFIFILVGYGTKAGLAPVHNWLPDAHSEAPSPISALLSGILLNTAFYGIMRFASVVEPSTGASFTGRLLVLFGLASVIVSSIFILVQSNFKRLLAYSSIEHMGIVSLGVGIGGPVGMYGALLHILNHALSKPLMFFASGRIQASYGSTAIDKVTGVLTSMPLLGALTFIGALSLAGAPPFNIFISEFTVLKAAADNNMWITVGIFLVFASVAFYGMLSGFGRMLYNGSKNPSADELSKEPEITPSKGHEPEKGIPGFLSNAVMVIMAVFIIFFGFHVPSFLDHTIRTCIDILGAR